MVVNPLNKMTWKRRGPDSSTEQYVNSIVHSGNLREYLQPLSSKTSSRVMTDFSY